MSDWPPRNRAGAARPRPRRLSRQWLYTQPWLGAEIERLLERHHPLEIGAVDTARERESPAQRLQTLRNENQRLREENSALRTELALAYGKRRERDLTAPPARGDQAS